MGISYRRRGIAKKAVAAVLIPLPPEAVTILPEPEVTARQQQDGADGNGAHQNGADGNLVIKVVIVDNHQVVSDSLRLLIDDQHDMEVVGVAASVESASNLSALRVPDVVLIDLHLPDGSGSAAAHAIRALYPATRIIILSRDESDEALAEAVSAGASAFLPKSRAGSEFIDGIRQVSGGISLITPAAVANVLIETRRREALRDSISPRQLKVLELMNEGVSSHEIATRLGISYSTVRSHIRAIEGKLASHSKVGAVVAARDLDLVS